MPDGLSLSTFAPILQARRNTVESADRPTAQMPNIFGISTPVDAPRAHEKPRESLPLSRGQVRWFRFRVLLLQGNRSRSFSSDTHQRCLGGTLDVCVQYTPA